MKTTQIALLCLPLFLASCAPSAPSSPSDHETTTLSEARNMDVVEFGVEQVKIFYLSSLSGSRNHDFPSPALINKWFVENKNTVEIVRVLQSQSSDDLGYYTVAITVFYKKRA